MGSLFKTTTISTPILTALETTNFTLNEDGSINKKHASTTIGSYAAVFSTNYSEEAKHDALIRKYASASVAESYVESLSDEELETALQKIGILEKELTEKNSTKRI